MLLAGYPDYQELERMTCNGDHNLRQGANTPTARMRGENLHNNRATIVL